ncbi:MAG: iron-sulfur cluster assembly accessory protein [Sedimenticola sp.]|jgi:iron-sulfur cluster assembly protein|nr:MAG: iron-sulfur cluster assembly accessory protein [Sedimenticola sp.]
MFELTESAAEQVRIASKEGGTEGMSLRLAAKMKQDGSIDYLMGFDEGNDEDIRLISNGVEIVMAPEFIPLLEDAVMDYVELEAGDFRFIFMNPLDANYEPPPRKRN